MSNPGQNATLEELNRKEDQILGQLQRHLPRTYQLLAGIRFEVPPQRAADYVHYGQKLRTVRVRDRSPDKVSDGLIRQVTLEVIPGSDQAAGAFDLQLYESPQRAEDVVADGVLPTHEESLGVAELLEGTVDVGTDLKLV